MDNDEFVLAMSSILHDIGKIEQRFKINENHATLGSQFIKNVITTLDKKNKERIGNLIKYHHTETDKTGLPEEDKYLLNILKQADWKSAAHDREDIDPKVFKDIKLEKISDSINLDCNKNNDNNTFYDLKTLGYFEDKSKNWGYQELYNEIVNDIKKLDFTNNNAYTIFNTLNTILFKDTVFAPSAFYYSKPNISLYHHLKLTAAMALSLYRYKKEYNKNMEINEKNNSFILLLCSISGIQDYIFRHYKAEASDDKGTKRLKGRSFMIKLLTDSIESYVLDRLNLYRFNIVWEKSDGFLLLMENGSNIDETLKTLRKEIDMGLIEKHRGLTANIAWVTASLDDFNTITREDDELHDENKQDPFADKMQRLYNNLDLRKRNKMVEIFTDPNLSEEDKYGKSINNMCESCGMDTIVDDRCRGCVEEEYIGTNLYKMPALETKIVKHIDEAPDRGEKIIFTYGNKDIEYHFITEKEENNANEIIKINEFNSKAANWRFILQAKAVPLKEKRVIKPLNELFGEEEKHKMLGVFKADVDNMGAIMAAGFKKLTISRLASISFEFEYFFSIKLDMIADSIKSNIYIVYSGGDDVSAIGEINDITAFSEKLYHEFIKYFNKKITLSAGISITPPKFPIRRGIMNAEENLGKAKKNEEKNEGKNSINYIDTMKWDKYIELSKLGDDIYNEIQRGKLSKGFPYFLQNLGNKFNREITQGTVISGTNVQSGNSILVPDPLLTYYIRRNYNSRDSNEAENLIKTLLADNDAKWKYMNFISSYIVIKVRKN